MAIFLTGDRNPVVMARTRMLSEVPVDRRGSGFTRRTRLVINFPNLWSYQVEAHLARVQAVISRFTDAGRIEMKRELDPTGTGPYSFEFDSNDGDAQLLIKAIPAKSKEDTVLARGDNYRLMRASERADFDEAMARAVNRSGQAVHSLQTGIPLDDLKKLG
jgi:hypothetical protein